VHERESLDAFTAMAEAVWLGLRRTDGVSREGFAARFGVDPVSHFQAALAPWRKRGCLHVTEASLKLTPSGLGLADAVAADLFQTGDAAPASEAESNPS
jgi:oxygen-independent coproporphyrinogen-3 oxidase